ncbi:hypothetical protein HDV04_002874 [Boothiomyces sp. JEL0838]|nr:hypothetical protein HDV04_002874 [Boothiomyces sp. JEL0838]
MTGNYGLALATLDSSSCVLLILYGIFFGTDFIVLAYSAGIRSILPPNFFICGVITGITQLLSRAIAIFFLITLNYECVWGRKLMYLLLYIGFIAYDYYQIKKIVERTRPNKYELVVFGLLFMGRISILAYNTANMSGFIVNPTTTGQYVGAGSCQSKVTGEMVYLEHSYNISMEIILIGKVCQFAYSLNSSKTNWISILRYVFDFEIFTFITYLGFEIAYLIAYQYMPAGQISFVNVFYNQIYVVLFVANAIHFFQDKVTKAKKLGLKVKQQQLLKFEESSQPTELMKKTEISK